MGSEVIGGAVALGLAFVVIAVGWRRDLDELTRSWLPRFGKAPELATATPGPSAGERARRPPSPRQKQLFIGCYLLVAAGNAVLAALSADYRPLRAATAVVVLAVLVMTLRRWKRSEAAEPQGSAG